MPSPLVTGRRPWKREDLKAQPPKNPPAYGARNVRIVVAGTGEALPGPGSAIREQPGL